MIGTTVFAQSTITKLHTDMLLANYCETTVLNPVIQKSARVFNEGVSGNTTKNLLRRVQKDCLDLKPDLTIIMVGTNDMVNGKYVPLQKYEQNLDQLVKKITISASKVLLLTILPFYEPYLLTRHPAAFFESEGPGGRRKQVNQVIESVAKKNGIYFFDIGSIFENVGKVGIDKNSLIRNVLNSGKTDGVHPTPNGYRFLALAVNQFIIYNNLPYHKVVCFGDCITRGDGSVDNESYPAYLMKLLP